MTVQAFRIQNFMAFEDTGWIELRPITLLFGRNSSGKSAIIRALRLLKQSLIALPDEEPLVFVAEEGLDQGSFLETVHNQRVEEPMVFHFRCRLGKGLDGLREVPLWEWISLRLGFRWDEQNRRIFLSLVQIDCPNESDQACLFAAEKLTNDKWNLTSQMLDQEALRLDYALWDKVILS